MLGFDFIGCVVESKGFCYDYGESYFAWTECGGGNFHRLDIDCSKTEKSRADSVRDANHFVAFAMDSDVIFHFRDLI